MADAIGGFRYACRAATRTPGVVGRRGRARWVLSSIIYPCSLTARPLAPPVGDATPSPHLFHRIHPGFPKYQLPFRRELPTLSIAQIG
jgi:hypothetical protein